MTFEQAAVVVVVVYAVCLLLMARALGFGTRALAKSDGWKR